jgi:hypothetical protein
MKHVASLLGMVALAVAPSVMAQRDPLDRVQQVLPAELAAEVLDLAQQARERGLPEAAVLRRALEGWAKGRRGDELSAAVRRLVGELAAARAALAAGGRAEPAAEAVEAAGVAMAMGVDAGAVSALAASAPSGRALAVPLLVTGGLVERGLPADGALEAVVARLAAGSSDAELLGLPDQAGAMLAQGIEARQVLAALASSRAGLPFPAGLRGPRPMGPPPGVPANGGLKGPRPTPRGRGPGGEPPAGHRP